MPDDLVDHWDVPPRQETGRGGTPVALVRALQRGVPYAIGPALVAASAMLLAGELFSAYRGVWPAAADQFPPADYGTAGKVGLIISQYSSGVPMLAASVPLLVLAVIAHLPSEIRPPVASPLRLVALLLSVVVALVGVVVLLTTTVWTLVTRGEVSTEADGGTYIMVDPVVTFLTRGGDGLTTAVLAVVAGWLLWTQPVETSEALDPAPPVAAEGAVGDVATTTATLPLEEAGALPLADPAYQRGVSMPGSPAPFVTRGSSEPLWQQTDPTVFRRPSAGAAPGPEPVPDDAASASADPAALFRRPAR